MALRKLTPALLRKIVLEERQRILREKAQEFVSDPIELEADEFGTDKALEDPEDFTVKEAKRCLQQITVMERDEKELLRKLKQIREAKSRAVRRLKK